MTTAAVSLPAVFLDRDGTLIDDSGYLSDPAAVLLLPGAAEALIALEQAGDRRIIVTTQSGIGRGMYPVSAFEATQRELERQLAEAGASIDATYCCPARTRRGLPLSQARHGALSRGDCRP